LNTPLPPKKDTSKKQKAWQAWFIPNGKPVYRGSLKLGEFKLLSDYDKYKNKTLIVSVAKRYGKATVRNKFRRIVKHSFIELNKELNFNKKIWIRYIGKEALNHETLRYLEIKKDIKKALKVLSSQ